jgi:hypothetical protein
MSSIIEPGQPVLVCTLGYHYTGTLVTLTALRVELRDVIQYTRAGQLQDMAQGKPSGAHGDPVGDVSLPAGLCAICRISALPERKQYNGE